MMTQLNLNTDCLATETPTSFGCDRLKFSVQKNWFDKSFRLGRLTIRHISLETPAFMPVGTLGCVKGLNSLDLQKLGYSLILGNTYHLALRPGLDTLQVMGGLKSFMSWPGLLLTDSGGFQVMSLAAIRRLSDDGVAISSHLSGEKLFLTPEKIVDWQHVIGSDLQMVLDQCEAYEASESAMRQALERTHLWAKRARDHHNSLKSFHAQLGIVQGGFRQDWRAESVEALTQLDFEAYAIGGVSVGEPRELYRDIVQYTTPLLPWERLRYVMGIGRPADLFFAVLQGADVFDCVMPTRNARNGTCFVRRDQSPDGIVRIKRLEFAQSADPLDRHCSCEACQTYSKGYLRHLFKTGEIAGLRLLTLHNLQFFADFFRDLRAAFALSDPDELFKELIRVDDVYVGLEAEFPWRSEFRSKFLNQPSVSL
jgi:queuine tRNA-ribosyltransferase